MQISEIQIEKFKGLKKATFRINPKLQVIAGPNNAGKTTLIKAIELFFSISSSDVDTSQFAPKNPYYLKEGRRTLTKIRISFNCLSELEKQIFSSAFAPRLGAIWCECRITRQGKVTFKASKKANGEETYSAVVDRYRIVHIPVLRIGDQGFASTETKRLMATVKEILVRSRRGKDSDEQKKFTRNINKVTASILKVLEEGKKTAKNLISEHSEIGFSTPGATEILDAILERTNIKSDTTKDLNLRDEGSGFQSLLSLGLLDYIAKKNRRRSENLLFLIEEPEAFLHPQYQRLVADYLKKSSGSAQIFVTTHSPIIIDSIDIRSVAGLKRDPAGLVWRWSPKDLTDTEAGKISRYSDAKNSELIFADKVIFCEGQTDLNVVRALARQILQVNSLPANVSIISMEGKDNAQKFGSLAKRFDIPFLFIFDLDFYSGSRDALKKLFKELNIETSSEFYAKLDRLKNQSCDSFSKAKNRREEANAEFQAHGIFCLGSDIEGAVSSSVKKTRFLSLIGPIRLDHLSEETVNELRQLSGKSYYKKLHQTLGSKGWDDSQKNNSKTPKPHILGSIIEEPGLSLVRGSDLAALKSCLHAFLANHTLKKNVG